MFNISFLSTIKSIYIKVISECTSFLGTKLTFKDAHVLHDLFDN